MTQTDRILRMLRDAGPSGITQLDVMRPLDGGPPIMALSQRIGDLRRAGHPITATRERTPGGANVARYLLTGDRSRGTVPGTPQPSCSSAQPAQPEEAALVHSSTTCPGLRA